MRALELNGTKIMHHVHALRAWSEGRAVYPLQVEISPTNICNHKCVFCAYDYISKKQKRFLDMALLEKSIRELKELGTKSLFYSGEGEPLLHKGLAALVEKAALLGFSQALNTNGVLMDGQRRERILPVLDWIRISLNAATAEEYATVHRCSAADFERVLFNIESMAALASQKQMTVTIGVQMVYMGQATQGLHALVTRLRNCGVHYFSLKCFNQHPNIPLRQFDVPDEELSSLQELATPEFHVALRTNIEKHSVKRQYTRCHGMNFYAEIISNGDVYSCGPHLGNALFCYGNIAQRSFKELWSADNRAAMQTRVDSLGNLDTLCMPYCRLHEINNFLWSLKHAPSHINFI